MVQRMGRTGRKKAGRVVVLVSQGKEEEVMYYIFLQLPLNQKMLIYFYLTDFKRMFGKQAISIESYFKVKTIECKSL